MLLEEFSPHTLKAYQLQSLLLIGYFKDVEMALLDTNKLKEYLAVSGKHLKPASLAHHIRFMKSLFRWSHEEGYLSKNPTSKIKEPLAQTRYIIKRIFNLAEINKEIHPHQLRHSYATHSMINGASI
ncbi:MAG: site-specific integrase [Psychrobacillus sp.]